MSTSTSIREDSTGRVSNFGILFGACQHCNGDVQMGNATITTHCLGCGVMYAFIPEPLMKKAELILAIVEKRFGRSGSYSEVTLLGDWEKMIRLLATRVNDELVVWATRDKILEDAELFGHIKQTAKRGSRNLEID